MCASDADAIVASFTEPVYRATEATVTETAPEPTVETPAVETERTIADVTFKVSSKEPDGNGRYKVTMTAPKVNRVQQELVLIYSQSPRIAAYLAAAIADAIDDYNASVEVDEDIAA